MFDEKFYASTTPVIKNAINKLDKLNKLSSKNQIDFKVILLPYEYQIRNVNSLEIKPQQLMSLKLNQKEIICLDPIQYLVDRKIPSKEMFLFGDGIHLSNVGHRLISEFVVKSLKQKMQ